MVCFFPGRNLANIWWNRRYIRRSLKCLNAGIGFSRQIPTSFPTCHKVLAKGLGPLLNQWTIIPGELAIDLTSASPAMASAMTLVGFPFSTQMLFIPSDEPSSRKQLHSSSSLSDHSENPWDEEALRIRQEACHAFNQGWHEASAHTFRTLEHRVSGGSKPFYRALMDIALGYGLWEQFQYRPAWEKLKSGIKALELASVWGGPPGMDPYHLFPQRQSPVCRIHCFRS